MLTPGIGIWILCLDGPNNLKPIMFKVNNAIMQLSIKEDNDESLDKILHAT